jgi:hypothetical protein
MGFWARACFQSYGDRSWFGKRLKGGWPGVQGEVRLGHPVVDKFGEVLVIHLTDAGYPKSRVLQG